MYAIRSYYDILQLLVQPVRADRGGGGGRTADIAQRAAGEALQLWCQVRPGAAVGRFLLYPAELNLFRTGGKQPTSTFSWSYSNGS